MPTPQVPSGDLPASITGRVLDRAAGGVRVREYHLWRDYRMSFHAHCTPGVVLPTAGRFRAEIDGIAYDIEPGRALVVPADAPHREAVGFGGAGCLLVEGGALRGDGPRVVRDERLMRLTERVRRAMTGSGGSADEAALTRATRDVFSVVNPPREASSGIPEWLTAAWARAQSEPARWTVRRLARSVSVAPETLSRGFARVFGVSPSEALRANRLEAAATALASCEEGISSVAYRFGFTDQSHLTRAFRRRYGTTPGRVRAGHLRTRQTPSAL